MLMWRNVPLAQRLKTIPKEAKPEEPGREVWKCVVQIHFFIAFRRMVASLPEVNELLLIHSFGIFYCSDDQTKKTSDPEC